MKLIRRNRGPITSLHRPMAVMPPFRVTYVMSRPISTTTTNTGVLGNRTIYTKSVHSRRPSTVIINQAKKYGTTMHLPNHFPDISLLISTMVLPGDSKLTLDIMKVMASVTIPARTITIHASCLALMNAGLTA